MRIAILDDFQTVVQEFARDRIAGVSVDVFETGTVEAIAACMKCSPVGAITP